MTNIYYVYQYLREDLTPYYIGKGKGNRAYQKHTIPLPKDKNRIVIIAENLKEKQAFNLEIELIAKYGRKDLGTGILHNMTDGGEGVSGWIPSKETRKKMSEVKKGKSPTIEARKKMSEVKKGKSPTIETIEKIKKSNTGKKRSSHTVVKMLGENNHRYGKSPTIHETTKRKESLKKYRDNNPNWANKWHEASKKAESKRLLKISKPVIIDGILYSSARVAFRELNNIKYTTLIKRIESDNFPSYYWKI